MYELVIRCYQDPEYRHVVATRETERELGPIEDGVNINLNHVGYYTEIVGAVDNSEQMI